MIPNNKPNSNQGIFNGIPINTDNLEDLSDIGKIPKENPLIIAFVQTTKCEDELKKLKDIYSVIPIKDLDAFQMFSKTNRHQKPMFVIDTGNACCGERAVEIAHWTKDQFPENIRIATGKKLREVGKLRYNNENACDLVKIYPELESFLRKRAEIKEKKKVLD